MTKVFISYSHRDEVWKDRLVGQLQVLQSLGIDAWHDRLIDAGDDWDDNIATAIATCDAAVLLVSRHTLTSKYIAEKEIPPLRERHVLGQCRLIPLIVGPCQWQRIDWLKPLQARPTDGVELSGMSEYDAEAALSQLAGEIADLFQLTAATAAPPPPAKARVEHNNLPLGGHHLFGRETELATLDAAWASGGRVRLVTLIAPGGTGKTALVRDWLLNLSQDAWRGARRVYAWSFYSQGTGDDRQASEDHFFTQALAWFGVSVAATADAHEKGRRLAEALGAQRTLLVLDGIEPLQYPPGRHGQAGHLRAPGLQALLVNLAENDGDGLCVVTSREALADLSGFARNASRPKGSLLEIDLANLGEADGARLLHAEGANRAGADEMADDDAELLDASRAVKGHALSLTLLGRYLALAYDGDIRQREHVKFEDADAETTHGHAFRVIAAYETWFARQDETGARELATLRLLGYFDRPAPAALLAELRAAPAIPGLTEALQDLGPPQWRATLARLRTARLLETDPDGTLDAHPLVREYFAAALEAHQPEAWQEGHRRLYEYLTTHTTHRPDTLEGLQPLYQAINHGCRAGLHQEACDAVYRDRILRGTGPGGFYSGNKLGAIGADLGAVVCFFVEPWRRPAPALAAGDQAWLLNEAAFGLRALGRLAEALEPMRAGTEQAVDEEDWKNAAASYGNLGELQLSLGRVDPAVADARRAVAYADRSGDAFQRMSKRATLADARHQGGEATARAGFAEAEAMQAEQQPDYPLLYSLPGFRYCDLLLAEAERAAWRGELGSGVAWVDARKPNTSAAMLGFVPQPNLRVIKEVAERARQTLEWEEGMQGAPLLDFALHHRTLARRALYADRLHARPAGAQDHTEAAVDRLRAAGQQDYLPRGLLTRAWLRHALGDRPGAEADLAEAQRIAARGGMRLHLADIALTRARLFRDRDQLAEARRLIEECGYWRRKEELADAEAALGVPSPLRGEG